MPEALYGIAKSESLADKTIQKLVEAGFESRNISALFHDSKNQLKKTIYTEAEEKGPKKGTKKNDVELQKEVKTPQETAEGAVAGGVIGGTIGLLMGVVALAVPGIGPLIAAGPIVAAVGGSAVGGSFGALVGALTGLGINQSEAKRYEESLKEGNILVSVQCNSEEEITKAKRIFTENKIMDITTTTQEKTKEK